MQNSPFKTVSVIGSGTFGTAIAHYLASTPDEVKPKTILYGRDPSVASEINSRHMNSKYLPGIPLSQNLHGTDSIRKAVEDSDLIIIGLPAQHVRDVLTEMKPYLPGPTPILSLAKGIEKDTEKKISAIIEEELRDISKGISYPVAALSGPSFAKDIAVGNPVGITIGSKNRNLLDRLHLMLNSPFFDVKITTDIDGVQTGGALKNIFGIVAGIFAGCKLGDSISGDYFTRSMVEMRDIGMFMGGRWATFSGRAGLGDLTITCTPASRNFRFGKLYAETFHDLSYSQKNPDLNEIHERAFHLTIEKLGTRTVEGFDTIGPIFKLVESNRIFTPIIRGIHRLLYTRDITPRELLGHIRTMDLARKKEGLRVYSIVMHEMFPRLWFRRH